MQSTGPWGTFHLPHGAAGSSSLSHITLFHHDHGVLWWEIHSLLTDPFASTPTHTGTLTSSRLAALPSLPPRAGTRPAAFEALVCVWVGGRREGQNENVGKQGGSKKQAAAEPQGL